MSVADAAGKDEEALAADLERVERLGVNDTRYWQLLTITLLKLRLTSRRFAYALKLPRKLLPRRQVGHGHVLSRHLIVKTGGDVRLTEAATMMYVADKTNIPVPKVLSAFVRKGAVYIVMERIQGQVFDIAWRHASEQARASLLEQLRALVDELRALPPPADFVIGSCTGGALQDFRQRRAKPPVQFGPFQTIPKFHSWLRNGLKQGEPVNVEEEELDDFKEMLVRQDSPWPPSVFTHGDLNPTNIIVRDNKIVGIIDWEMSGWYPHYWEYTSLKIASFLVNQFWDRTIDKFLNPFPDDLKMERIRFYWWGNVC